MSGVRVSRPVVWSADLRGRWAGVTRDDGLVQCAGVLCSARSCCHFSWSWTRALRYVRYRDCSQSVHFCSVVGTVRAQPCHVEWNMVLFCSENLYGNISLYCYRVENCFLPVLMQRVGWSFLFEFKILHVTLGICSQSAFSSMKLWR